MTKGKINRRDQELDEEIEQLMQEARQRAGVEDEPTEDTPTTTEVVEESGAESPEILTKEESTYKNRYGELRRHSQKKEDEFKAKIQELERRLNEGPRATELPTDPEKVNEWVNKYPEVAAIIVSLSKDANKSTTEELQSRMKELEETRLEIEREKAQAKIRKAHPDFDEVVNDDFHSWAEKQPKHIQDRVYDNDNPDDVIWVLDIYKKLTAKSDPVGVARDVGVKSKSTAPKSDPSAKRWKESDVARMSPREYDQNEEAISEAIRSGNFEYDISGAAR